LFETGLRLCGFARQCDADAFEALRLWRISEANPLFSCTDGWLKAKTAVRSTRFVLGLSFPHLTDIRKKCKKEKPCASKLLSYVSLLRNENSISCAFAGPKAPKACPPLVEPCVIPHVRDLPALKRLRCDSAFSEVRIVQPAKSGLWKKLERPFVG